MLEGLTLRERDEILARLGQSFEPPAAEALVEVLDRVVAWRAEMVTKSDFQELQRLMGQVLEGQRVLQEAVARLAEGQDRLTEGQNRLIEAQARTEERVGRLEEAQIRTEERMGRLEEAMTRLAEAQARTEERVGRLEEAQTRLAEAQARTEEQMGWLEEAMLRLTEAQRRTEEQVGRLEEAQIRTEERMGRLEEALARLAEGQNRLTEAQAQTEQELQRLSRQVGGLSDRMGGELEDQAYEALPEVLKRELGWEVGPLERVLQEWNGEAEEINIFGQARDPAQPERVIWIVGEAKYNLTITEVNRFAQQVERARQHLTGEVFPLCYCFRARQPVQKRLQQLGIRLVLSYGRMI